MRRRLYRIYCYEHFRDDSVTPALRQETKWLRNHDDTSSFIAASYDREFLIYR